MNINIRKIIYKFSFIHNMCIKHVQNKNLKFYRKICKKRKGIAELNLKNKFKNKRCFIVGNGPSLTVQDLDRLVGEDCFAANLIFKIFDKTKWRPKFYCIQDRYARIGDFLDKTDLEYIFVGSYFWRTKNFNNKNAYCFHSKRTAKNEDIKFSFDPEEYVYDAYTVTYTMLQMAVFMGYKEIYLLGIDHNYSRIIEKNGGVRVADTVKSHFFKDDNPAEVIANIYMMEKGYYKAKSVSDELGIKIYNVTRGGKLEIFERYDLEEII